MKAFELRNSITALRVMPPIVKSVLAKGHVLSAAPKRCWGFGDDEGFEESSRTFAAKQKRENVQLVGFPDCSTFRIYERAWLYRPRRF
jgi:hypothetical protein